MLAPTFPDFVKLGAAHIFAGYDHLAFLLGLLLVCPRGGLLIAIVTSFTAGHSLTLALATLGLVNLSPHLTEPLIALTIFAVGADNLMHWGKPMRYRWLVALIFGLVHGFGFATVLRELGVGSDGRAIALPLLGFNLGVEIGQLAFAAIVLPVFIWAKSRPAYEQRIGPAFSALVMLAGIYWLVERLLLV